MGSATSTGDFSMRMASTARLRSACYSVLPRRSAAPVVVSQIFSGLHPGHVLDAHVGFLCRWTFVNPFGGPQDEGPLRRTAVCLGDLPPSRRERRTPPIPDYRPPRSTPPAPMSEPLCHQLLWRASMRESGSTGSSDRRRGRRRGPGVHRPLRQRLLPMSPSMVPSGGIPVPVRQRVSLRSLPGLLRGLSNTAGMRSSGASSRDLVSP